MSVSTTNCPGRFQGTSTWPAKTKHATNSCQRHRAPLPSFVHYVDKNPSAACRTPQTRDTRPRVTAMGQVP